MTTNKPEVFEVYRTKQGTLENVVLLADYEALQAGCDALVEALEELMLRAHPAYVGDDLMREKLITARELGHDALSAYREKRGGNYD